MQKASGIFGFRLHWRNGKIVFQTALTQFDADDFEMHIFSFVKTVDEIDNIIFQAKQKNASIIYTIVLKVSMSI